MSTGARSPRPLLEIAANSMMSALAAQEGGADRVELCENLGEGGTTPSYGTVAMAREQLRIPLYVLIRPRAGDFLYLPGEVEIMRRDIELCARLGCEGVVIGALDAEAAVDMQVCRELISCAGAMGVTFHRAFDVAHASAQALEQVIELGCERVLTSGAHAGAEQGAATIAARVAQAGDRIRIMAGAGLTPDNLRAVMHRSGAHEFHASAKQMQISRMDHRAHPLPGLAPGHQQTGVERVRALLAQMRG